MNVALAAAVFAPGLAIGSFLNVVAARLPLKRSVVRPRSACMQCAQELRWYDNVPLVSYAMLRGRCRHCGVRIALVYPAVELATALLVAGCVLAFGLTGRAAVSAFSSPFRRSTPNTGSSRTGSSCLPPQSCSSRTAL